MKLRPQHGFNTCARLVVGPQFVAKRLDDVIGRDTHVRGAFLNHLQYAIQHADDRAEGAIFVFRESPQAVEVAEQLVRAVDEVNDHVCLDMRSSTSAEGWRCRALRQPGTASIKARW